MAIIKSSALGQARKSIGATNYYRRSGVQISRNKPVFAPGRTFTPAQLLQQDVMKIGQYILLTKGAKIITDYCNVPNNKNYNASSRYNRFLQNTMVDIKQARGNVIIDPEDFWNEKCPAAISNYSVGNIEHFYTELKGQSAANELTLMYYVDELTMNRILSQANKRRSPSSRFTPLNFGACGFYNEDPAGGGTTHVLQPTMTNAEDGWLGEYLSFAFKINDSVPLGLGGRMAFNIFLADRTSNVSLIPLSIPQWCSSSAWVFSLAEFVPDDRPVIE